MLAATIADQTLQAVRGRDPEVLDISRGMDQLELPQGRSLHGAINALDVLLMPDALVFLLPNDLITSTVYDGVRQ